MRRSILIILITVSLAGCGRQITTEQMEMAEGWVKSPIVWIRTETGRNPWSDGQIICIDLTYMEKYNLPLRPIVLHEEYHNRGITEHCPEPKCLMYPVYQYDVIFGAARKELCYRCRPTTLGWLERMRQ